MTSPMKESNLLRNRQFDNDQRHLEEEKETWSRYNLKSVAVITIYFSDQFYMQNLRKLTDKTRSSRRNVFGNEGRPKGC